MGAPYEGNDPGLIARQQAIDEGLKNGTIQVIDVVKPNGRVGEKNLSQIRQNLVKMRIPADRRFYSKPDLEYAGIPKGDRNNKFRTMNFRLTQAEKDAQKIWNDKRDIYSR